MSMYHFSDAEAVEHDVNTVPDSGDFERVEIDGQWYVPELTCHMVRDNLTDTTYCDVCGERFDQPWYTGFERTSETDMVTDEERRAVVARLRDSAEKRMASKGKGNGNSWSWLYRSVFGYYMGTKKGAKGHYVEVAHRLADLIEPEPERTCEMVDNGRELCCSACDWRHDYDDEPVYCSGCGARVVSE